MLPFVFQTYLKNTRRVGRFCGWPTRADSTISDRTNQSIQLETRYRKTDRVRLPSMIRSITTGQFLIQSNRELTTEILNCPFESDGAVVKLNSCRFPWTIKTWNRIRSDVKSLKTKLITFHSVLIPSFSFLFFPHFSCSLPILHTYQTQIFIYHRLLVLEPNNFSQTVYIFPYTILDSFYRTQFYHSPTFLLHSIQASVTLYSIVSIVHNCIIHQHFSYTLNKLLLLFAPKYRKE